MVPVNMSVPTLIQDTDKVILLGPPPLVEKLLTPEDRDWIVANEGEESTHKVKLGYEDYTRRVIFRAILPLDLEVAGNFEEAGHIAHYNLRDEYLPYKEIIGEAYFLCFFPFFASPPTHVLCTY